MTSSIYETKKMHVDIQPEYVLKVFKKTPGYLTRYHREKRALKRLSNIPGMPQLIECSDNTPSLKMTRLPGDNPTWLSDKSLLQLKGMVDQMLSQGIARHSLPERDILVDEAGNVSLVDFERITLKSKRTAPIWKLADKVTRFHLSRLIHQHNPMLLTPHERRQLELGLALRESFNKVRKVRNKVRGIWRHSHH